MIDADLSGYFDSIPHDKLMELVARRISDGTVLALIRAWLQAPIVEEDRARGSKRTLPNKQGTPQGGVISPLLTNLYLDKLDQAVNDRCGNVPVMVRYADDFVILCPKGRGAAYLQRLKSWLAGRKLKLNENKTRLLNARQDRFKFLGFRIHLAQSARTRRTYAHVEPHPKSCQKLRDNIRSVLNHWTLHVPEEEAIKTLNRKLKGWGAYFHFANSTRAFTCMQHYVCARVRRWLWRRHKRKGSQYERYTDEILYQRFNGPRGNMHQPKDNRLSVLGKPDAGNPHVRFDEGWRDARETDNCGRFNSPRVSPPTLPLFSWGGLGRRAAAESNSSRSALSTLLSRCKAVYSQRFRVSSSPCRHVATPCVASYGVEWL